MKKSNNPLSYLNEPSHPLMNPALLFNPSSSSSHTLQFPATQMDPLLSSKIEPEPHMITKCEFSFEEARDIVTMQLSFLNKEEGELKEKLEILETQRVSYLKIKRKMLDEENCRFGRKAKAESGWPLLNERYQVLALLGKGGFSEVYKAFDLQEMRLVACKIHHLSPHWSLASRSNYIRHALRENQVHRFLKHLNIVEHYDSVEIDSNSFCTVLEYCDGPDLGTYLRTHKTLSEREAKMIVKQIISGLLFLNQKHDARIIHYDLKPQNILFSNGIPKISDFGLCKVMNEDDTKLELTSQGVGTYYYLPPECFLRSHKSPVMISTKVDIWSLGIIFFEMLYGFRPFGHNLSQERILKEGVMLRARQVDFPSRPNVSQETKNFIERALAYHQEDRLDVFQAAQLLSKSGR